MRTGARVILMVAAAGAGMAVAWGAGAATESVAATQGAARNTNRFFNQNLGPPEMVAATRMVATTPEPTAATKVPATQRAATTHPAEPAVAALEARWSDVLNRLGSASYKDRVAAQADIEKATWRDLPALKKLAANATDPEVKARLSNRVDELEVQLAFDPPPIDFDVQDGTVQNVAEQLQKALGVPLRTYNSGGPPETYTLHVKEKPFWQVFLALSAQHPLRLQQYRGLQLMQTNPGIVRGEVQEGFLFYPESVSRNLTLQEHAAPPGGASPAGANVNARKYEGKAKLTFAFGVMGDPRLKLVPYGAMEITSVVDDKGHVLYKAPAQNNGRMGIPGLIQAQGSGSWEIPEGMGKTFTVKGTMSVLAVLSETTVEVPDMVKQGKTPIEIGGQELVWTRFESKDRLIQFQVQMRPKAGAAPGGPIKPVMITIADGSGQQLISQQIQGGWGGGIGGGNGGPYKATFSMPTRTVAKTVPFEFKNLPVP